MYDQDTIKRVMNGDKDAFSKMYNELSPTIYRQVYDKLQDHAQAREAVRNIFLDIYRHCTQLRDYTLFDEWVASLVRFYTDQNATQQVIKNNPDLQVVWEGISAAIESGEGEKQEETPPQTSESTGDDTSTLDIQLSDVSEDWQNILDNVEKEMSALHQAEEAAQRGKKFPGVDEEVTRLIEELATDDWSPILFPPDEADDGSVSQASIDPPWMRSWTAAPQEKAQGDVKKQPEARAQSPVMEEVSVAKEGQPNRFDPAALEEDLSENTWEEVSAQIDCEADLMKPDSSDDTLQNVTLFPGNIALMDRSNAERNDPPEWLTSGPLPNIDDMVMTRKNVGRALNDAAPEIMQETVVGSVALKKDMQPIIQSDAMQDKESGREDQEKQTIELLENPMLEDEPKLEEKETEAIVDSETEDSKIEEMETEKVSEETKTEEDAKEAKIHYESVHVEIDHINSRVAFERVPYEYIPYEENSRAVYDRLNNEYFDRLDEEKDIQKNRVTEETIPIHQDEYEHPNEIRADGIFTEKSASNPSGFESVVLPPKKQKKSRVGVVFLVLTVLVIGVAVVYAKMTGLI